MFLLNKYIIKAYEINLYLKQVNILNIYIEIIKKNTIYHF